MPEFQQLNLKICSQIHGIDMCLNIQTFSATCRVDWRFFFFLKGRDSNAVFVHSKSFVFDSSRIKEKVIET